MTWLLGLWGKAKATILMVAMGILFFIGYGIKKKQEGRNEVKEEDRDYIAKAGQDKRTTERRLRNDPISTDDRRERLRRERDELRKLLQSN